MTEFQKEIFRAINGSEYPPEIGSPLTEELQNMAESEAILISLIVMPFIKEAFDANPLVDVQNMCGMITVEDLWENFQKRNGLK